MKKNFITAIFTLVTICFVNAQDGSYSNLKSEMKSANGVTFAKGDMFLEGSIKVSTGGSKDYYALNPKFGYFLNDKLAVGADVGFSSEKVDSPEKETTIFGVGGFARYYFLELNKKKFKAYGEAGLGYGRNEIETSGNKDVDNSITADLNVGLNYFFTENLAATFTLANILSYNSVSPEDGASSDTFELNINLFENIFDQPQFGLMYRF